MENTGRKTPSLVETEEEECFLEPWTVVSIMSLSSDDEMSDEEPSPVETVEKYPKETLNVESTVSIPVAVGEMENLTDVIFSDCVFFFALNPSILSRGRWTCCIKRVKFILVILESLAGALNTDT